LNFTGIFYGILVFLGTFGQWHIFEEILKPTFNSDLATTPAVVQIKTNDLRFPVQI
jgi:hypothetical protein